MIGTEAVLRTAVPPCTVSVEAGEAILQQQWGATYDLRNGLALEAARTRGVLDQLDQTGYSSHPEVVALFSRLGAQDRIDGIMRDPRHPHYRAYREAFHRDHVAVVRYVTSLHTLAMR